MSDRDIESKIQAAGKTAPRVTPADIEANIASEHYFTAAQGAMRASLEHERADFVALPQALTLLTFCVLVLRNGFTVTGESACASPENFDAEIGRQIARQNAVAKIWPLMGYELRSQLAARAGLPPIEGVLDDVRIVPAAGATPMPSTSETLEALANAITDAPLAAEIADHWKPTIGRIVTVKGYIANGSDEHPGMITRVFGAGEGALVNVTVFPDLQSPKILSSIPAYTSRTAARDAIVGPSRANGYAFFPDRG
ncbi:hypothetical protein HTY52_12870 [Cupriavidus taiwanensis]|uniref:Gp49 family protein n=1 Tax=Cupriavidus taiwanensis TaxID=164546 RepID=UPI001571DE04|nr:hypothetical protein [Cupriavidus taiwanensis]